MYSSPKDWLLRLLCCALLLAGGMTVFAQNTPEEDDFLQLLRQELRRQSDSLQHSEQQAYFMAYRVKETTEHRMTANFGKIYDKSSAKSIVLTIELRVGNQETDNYHYLTHKNTFVKQIPLPLDGNPDIVRKILRNETRKAYQEAVIQCIENKVAETLLFGEEDYEKFLYMRQDLDGYYEPPVTESDWNEAHIEQSLCHATGLHHSDLREESAVLVYQTSRKYLVNSENSYFVENHTSTMLTLRVEGLTPDNIPEHIERQHFVYFPEQLPDMEELRKEMEEMETLLSSVVLAEKCELTHAPVLLSPYASAVLIHNLLGHDLENQDNNWLRNRLWRQVLPESFSVYSDPTLTPIHGVYPGGSYMFDDEGVKGHRVQHVDHGVFRQFLSTRMQQSNAFKSNGNARGNTLLPSARQSNLVLESDKTLDTDELFKQLNQLNDDQDYALFVSEVEIRCDTNDLVSIYPTVCYKIYAHHRKPDEIVRDVILTGTKQQWLNNLVAASYGSNCVTMTCNSQQDDLLTSTTAPMLLFRNAEIRQQPKTPQFRIKRNLTGTGANVPMSTAEVFRFSAQHEWQIDVDQLKVAEETAPYYEEFLMTDARIYTVEASEGSVFYANEKPVRQFVPRLLLGSDRFNNENLTEETVPTSYPLPFENHTTFAKDFRDAADAEYREVLKQWKTKQAQQSTPESHTLPERSYAPATQSDEERTFDYPTMNNLEHFASEASSLLAKHDFLSRSGVNIYIMMGNAYFWNSEKTTYSRPVSVISMQVYGAVEKADGEEYMDTKTLFFPCTDSLFSAQYAKNEIDMLVTHLKKVNEKGVSFEGNYWAGPMLVEGEAVGQVLMTALLGGYPNLLTNRKEADGSWITEESLRQGVHPFEQLLDRIITSRKISVTANVVGDVFDLATFVRHDKTDAEGVETQETEIIRNGELITLMGNRVPTKATPFSNGFQQLAFHCDGFVLAKGASRLDFDHKTAVSHEKLKKMLLREAKKQGSRHAYILRQVYDDNMQNIICRNNPNLPLLQLYRVDVRTGEEIPVTDAYLMSSYFHFFMLNDIQAVSNQKVAYPVMTKVKGVSGTRDFPFAGVPTCIVAPDAMMINSVSIKY
ncbi:MAG: hypothetical protein IKZ54_05035 [Bacteroidales bacterium]|nr:hypothetical protein [Bacteroidales bacterium]